MIGHSLVLGKTLSGKTSLVKRMTIAASTEDDTPVFVLTPHVQDAGWKHCDHVTKDDAEFLKLAFNSTDAQLVIDEAGRYCKKSDEGMWRIASESRHHGHQAFFIAQRQQMIDKTIREQCTNLFLFQQGPDDAQILYGQFVDRLILEAPSLPPGVCIVKIGDSPAFKMKVF
ncbi:hypothetical protein [Vampirovibrio chlorellavorus]|uniref:hypothetical protein n=1 Tax=Vampirovibrio chlorellavorus TaxID=758823 RepID=UPI0026F1D273|nr:hypothetical protein [Vampirovibrio chlorellavorus]